MTTWRCRGTFVAGAAGNRGWGFHMKAKLFGLVACVALFGVSQARSATITYNVDIVSGSSSITGSITTDATIGKLSVTNVKDWNLKVIDSLATFSLTGPLSGNNSIVGGIFLESVVASATDLDFLFGNTREDDFEFATRTNPSALDFLDAGIESPSGLINIVNNGLGEVQFDPTTDVIGTVATTLLPAALPLFATGLGAMGLFGWRRKRKNTATIAA